MNVLLSYKRDPVLGFDIEVIEGFTSTGDRTASGARKYSRTGTAIGPGITLSAPELPLYARASLPIHFEPSPVTVGLRAAGGLTFNVVEVSLYIEAVVDFSLAGTAVSAFDKRVVSGGTGLWYRF